MEQTHTIEFMQFTKTEQAHSVLPDPNTVFSCKDYEGMEEKMRPLLTIDLSQTHFQLPEKIHFIYHESFSLDQISFKVDKGKYTEILFEEPGHRECLETFENRFEIDGENIQKGWIKSYPHTFSFATAYEKETGMARPYVKDIEGYEEVLGKIRKEVQPKDDKGTVPCRFYAGELNSLNFIGALPYFIQNGGYYPTDPDGNDMLFIGQCQASRFGLADVALYLFYSSKHNLITQINQVT